MRRLLRRSRCCVLMAALMLAFMPGTAALSAEAYTEPEEVTVRVCANNLDRTIAGEGMCVPASAEGVSVTEPAVTDTIASDAGTGEGDELLSGYLEEKAAENIAETEAETSAGTYSRKAALSGSRGSNLSGVNLKIYKILAECISETAAGSRSSTVFKLSANDIFSKTSYTKKELGVSSILVTSGGSTSISSEALNAFYAKLSYDFDLILDSLLSDMPYELYWYDKEAGSAYGFGSISADDNSIWLAGDDPELSFSFYVSADYSGSGNRKTTAINTTLTKKAAKFAANAAKIITANSSQTDWKKLIAYKDAICDAASYNTAAAKGKVSYGDPWQMIYVFDGDSSTSVVCEGYSKAFQFLCDQTSFNSSRIETWSVTGKMSGGTGAGSHMWNIVHMPDGRNYLADITNCDSGTIGADDLLFLKGCSAGGSVDDGYYYPCSASGGVTYVYDTSTASLYTTSELTMSASDYDGTGAVETCDHANIETVILNKKAATYTAAGSCDKVVRCAGCGKVYNTVHVTIDKLKLVNGAELKISGSTYKVISVSGRTVSLTKAKNVKNFIVPAAVRINGKSYKVVQINAKSFCGSKIRTVTAGKNVKVIRKNAFASSKAVRLILKTSLLKKSSVTSCLKSSKVKTVKVSISSKLNKKYIKAYKKIFTKANAGRKVTIC